MTMPLDPYFNNLRVQTDAFLSGRSLALAFFLSATPMATHPTKAT